MLLDIVLPKYPLNTYKNIYLTFFFFKLKMTKGRDYCLKQSRQPNSYGYRLASSSKETRNLVILSDDNMLKNFFTQPTNVFNKLWSFLTFENNN